MRNKAGFTLLELSLVLVIVGLLAAGAVSGGELIRQAEIQRIAERANLYSRAIHQFTVKYMALPGDFAQASQYFGPVCKDWAGIYTCDGNGNGRIEQANETLRAFEHLSRSGILSGFEVENQPSDSQPYADAKAMAHIDKGYFAYVSLAGSGQNLLSLVNEENGEYTGALDAVAARIIDRKLDDGLAYNGKVRAYDLPEGQTLCVAPDSQGKMGYTTNESSPACAMTFTIR